MKTIDNENGRTVGSTIHAFEAAGLGKAPFRFTGFSVRKYCACPGAPVQPGGTCDFCGEAIMNCFSIRSADGKDFVVGCNCVEKTGDTGLRRVVDREIREARNKAAHARLDAKIARAKELLPKVAEAMKAQPHPQDYRAAAGQTYLDMVNWYLANAGRKGASEMLGVIERFAAKHGVAL